MKCMVRGRGGADEKECGEGGREWYCGNFEKGMVLDQRRNGRIVAGEFF